MDCDICIIGGGFGGLLTGAYLANAGYNVFIIEKLPFLGGRFANINYKGFQLSTGAVHTIPHRRGLVVNAIKELGLKVKLIDIRDIGVFKDEDIQKLDDRFLITSFLNPRSRDLDAIYRFSIGLSSNELSFINKLRFILSILKFGRPAVLKGGCSALIKELSKKLINHDSTILLRTKVTRLVVSNSKIVEVIARQINGEKIRIKPTVVVSNIGFIEAISLINNNFNFNKAMKLSKKLKPVMGIRINFSCSHKPFGKYGLVFTPCCEKIAGLIVPTIADPSLAPQGTHLIMTHQELTNTDNVSKEISGALSDIKKLLPEFDKECSILSIQVFRNKWPVNRVAQGKDLNSHLEKIDNLFFVGDAFKLKNWLYLHVMTEGISGGVKKVVNEILSRF